MFVLSITVDVMEDRNAAVAHVISEYDGAVLASGSSKREPGDPYIPGVGSKLAVARALHDYAAFVETHAYCDGGLG